MQPCKSRHNHVKSEKFRKWKVNFPNRPTSDLVKEARTAADVIRNIDDALTDLKFDWT